MRKVTARKLLLILLAFVIFQTAVPAQEADVKLAKADALIEEAGKLIDQNTLPTLEQALVKVGEARKIFEELKKSEKVYITRGYEGFARQRIGLLYAGKNEFDTAKKSLEQALKIYQEIGYEEGIAGAAYTLAYVSLKQETPDRALSYYAIALPIYIKAGSEIDAANVQQTVGYIYYDKKDYAKAAENLEQSLALFKKLKNRESQVEVANTLGDIYLADLKYEKAQTYYLETLPFFRENKNHLKEAVILHNIGFAASRLEKFTDSLMYYEQALSAYRRAQDVAGEVSILRNLGLLNQSLEKYKKAIDNFETAIRLKDKIKDQALVADLYSNAGTAYSSLTDYQNAAVFYEKAVQIRRELKQKTEFANELDNLARTYLALFQYEKSNGFYEEELHFNEKENQTGGQIYSLLGLRRNSQILNRTSEAENYLRRAVALVDKLTETDDRGALLEEIGRGFYGQKNYDESLKYFNKALEIFRADKNKFNQMLALSDIGMTYLFSEQYESAADYFRQAQTIAVETKDKYHIIYSYFNLGDVEYLNNRYAQSLALYEKGLAEISVETKKKDNPFESFKEIVSLIDAANNVPKFEMDTRRGAVNSFNAVRLGSAGTDTNNLLQSGENLRNAKLLSIGWFKKGAAQNELGRYSESLESLQKSLQYARESSDKWDEMNALGGLASTNSEMGNYSQSIEANQKALKISREVSDKYSESQYLNNLGVAYLRLGSLEKAEEFVQQSSKIVETLNDPRLSAQAEGNLGAVFARLKQYDKALGLFALSIPKFYAQKNYKFAVVISYYQGTVLRETGDIQRAAEVHKKSAEVASVNSMPKFESRALSELGLDYVELKEFEKAIPVFEKALVLAQTAQAKDEQAAAFDGLMQVYKGLGKNAAAIFYGKQSVNILQKIRGEAEKIDKDVQTNFLKDNTAIYRRLADLLSGEGRLPEAQQVLEMLKDKEYSQFLSRDADEAASLAKITERPDEKEALEKYSEYSKTLAADGAELGRLEVEKNNLKEGEQFGKQARYDELKNRIETTNKAFRVLLEKTLANDIDKTKVKDIKNDRALQGKLAKWGDGTVALYTVITEDRYRVILTTPKTQVDGKTEIKAAELNKKISDFRQILLDPTLDPRPLGKELYDILIKPIEANLINAQAKTLLWSLDGSLSYIPIGTLFDGEKYLAEKYQNVVVTSTTRASLDEETNKDWHVLGAGVTGSSEVKEPFGTGRIPFKALPAVGEELTTIVKTEGGKGTEGILPGLRLVDATFTEAALKENVASRNANGRKYNVIHFATHFRLGNLPENSFLLLGNNEILTLEEVNDSTDLELSGIELVTLSACNTGFGGISGISADNKAIDSLAAFIESRGAKSVIATLWAVNDESTSLLMGEFYRLRKENPNITKAEALQTAQKMMIAGKLKPSADAKDDRSGVVPLGETKVNAPKFTFDGKKPFAHPLFWSPFVLIGNWR